MIPFWCQLVTEARSLHPLWVRLSGVLLIYPKNLCPWCLTCILTLAGHKTVFLCSFSQGIYLAPRFHVDTLVPVIFGDWQWRMLTWSWDGPLYTDSCSLKFSFPLVNSFFYCSYHHGGSRGHENLLSID